MISSPDNRKIKHIEQLRDKGKVRRKEGLFLAEGPKMFLEAKTDELREVYVSEGALDSLSPLCREKLECLPFPYEIVSDGIFAHMSDARTPQGILCVAAMRAYDVEDLLSAPAPLLLLLEDVQDPGNVGTMFRAGEGAGIDGVLMTDGTADIYAPKTVRSTMGSLFRIPHVRMESFDDVLPVLRAHGISLYAADLQGAVDYDTLDYRKGTAFLIGNESRGLRKETAAQCDKSVLIPMKGKVESLNAAMASTILLYEAARQRRSDGQ